MTRTIRTPTPLTPSPLSATRPKLQASPTAERGARGVRSGIHSLKMTHSHLEG